jgi:hypothetical protein
MARAGFRVVVNYASWRGTPDQIRAYADAAGRAGLKVIWSMLDWLKGTPAYTLEDAVRIVRGHPATWGFYLPEEMDPVQASEVAALGSRLEELAPGKPRLYVSRPNRGELAPFAHSADYLGADAYPVGFSDPPVRRVAKWVRKLARRSVLVLQAFAWGQDFAGWSLRFPTRRQMLKFRNQALLAKPRLILWFSYPHIVGDYTVTPPGPSVAPQKRWRMLRKAAFAPRPQRR